MGSGRRLGLQLKAWLNSQAFDVMNGAALGNRLIDALGDDDFFRGPLKDLASQPLFRQVLQQRGGGQRLSLDQLDHRLAATYAPAVLEELRDLLEAATDLTLVRVHPTGDPGESPDQPEAVVSSKEALAHRVAAGSVGADLKAISPGVLLASSSSLVLWWAAARIEGLLPGQHHGGGGLLLALAMLLLQALALGPFRWIRRQWPLDPQTAINPHQSWRWLLSPWIHQRSAEGFTQGLALVVLMTSAPAGRPLLALRSLDLPTVVLRYGLTVLATTALAVLVARHLQVQKTWSGASSVVGALVSFAAIDGLVHRQAIQLGSGVLQVPAWVLLLVLGALQLTWELPPQAKESSRPWQRLLASSWCWGTLLGLSVGIVSWGMEGLRHLQASGRV
jgi:hypothetical protein